MARILITGFEPFGFIGRLLKRNESEVVARKLEKKYACEVLILPVSHLCVPILRAKILSFKPELIVLLGQAEKFRTGLRVESSCCWDSQVYINEFAQKVQEHFGLLENNIGDWFCNDVYAEALRMANRQKFLQEAIFLHLPMFCQFKLVEEIFVYILELYKSLNKSGELLNNGRDRSSSDRDNRNN